MKHQSWRQKGTIHLPKKIHSDFNLSRNRMYTFPPPNIPQTGIRPENGQETPTIEGT